MVKDLSPWCFIPFSFLYYVFFLQGFSLSLDNPLAELIKVR